MAHTLFYYFLLRPDVLYSHSSIQLFTQWLHCRMLAQIYSNIGAKWGSVSRSRKLRHVGKASPHVKMFKALDWPTTAHDDVCFQRSDTFFIKNWQLIWLDLVGGEINIFFRGGSSHCFPSHKKVSSLCPQVRVKSQVKSRKVPSRVLHQDQQVSSWVWFLLLNVSSPFKSFLSQSYIYTHHVCFLELYLFIKNISWIPYEWMHSHFKNHEISWKAMFTSLFRPYSPWVSS